MRYYVIAGEASGDLHGSNLIKQLQLSDSSAHIRCWGGDLMQAAGSHLVKHYRDLAFMGFTEVIMNLPTILGNLKFCKEDIISYQPDVLILIDYPGFNLRIAEWAKKQGFKVVYYIAPQVWAWKANRVKKMKTCIDLMLCILPFEKDYFKNYWNWDVQYVGHPLIEVIEKFKSANQSDIKPIVALLPGSRKQEIAKKLPIMLSVAAHFPQFEFVVAKAPGQEDDFYEPFLADQQNVKVVKDSTYALLNQASAALVTSGTATLETALFGVPEIVCYKGSAISYQIAKRLVKIKFISLVNLIMDKEIVKELIQDELNNANLVRELQFITSNPKKISELKSEYQLLYKKLAGGGHASKNAANLISKFLQNQ